MTIQKSKAPIDEAETLLTVIRGGVLVHLHEGVFPEHLRGPLDSARALNKYAAEIGDERVVTAADALEAWLALLVSESGMISHTRAHSLLDQISEVEVALVAYRTANHTAADNVADFVDESFRSLSAASEGGQKRPTEDSVDTIEEAFEIDVEMLDVFREEAASLLEGMRSGLEILSSRPSDREALWEVKRNAHTLKGAAGIVGLGKLSTLAHHVEDLLGRISETEAGSISKTIQLLLDATACLSALAEGESSPSLEAEIATLEREFTDVHSGIVDEGEGEIEQPEKMSQPAIDPVQADSSQTAVRNGRIVRVSLDRLDDLVKIVCGLESSRRSFEECIDDLGRQLEELHNNRLRLQGASGKIEKLEIFPAPLRGETSWQQTEFDQITYELAETARDASVIDTALGSVRSGLEELYEHQRALIERIQERLVRLRNVEFGSIATRLQRTVRVTCDEEGKLADIELYNGAVEVDTQVIDALIEPLMHLLKNAIVHGIEPPETRRLLGKPEVGRITIRVDNDGPYVVVTVADDGRGIADQPLIEKAIASGRVSREEAARMSPTEIRDLIFVPGLTTAGQVSLNAGRGVGMSIVRESLAAAGGTISIETRPQCGTTFTVQLPNLFGGVSLSSSGIVTNEANARSDSGELKILVVDDSPSVRMMTTRTIRAAGWRAESAKNGIDALKKLTAMAELPNLILSDIEMPLMGGYEFIAAVRSEWSLKEIPIVIVSSRTGAEDRKQALAAGAIEYVTKPYDDSHLTDLIDRLALRTHVTM